jgi:hypothetical protein
VICSDVRLAVILLGRLLEATGTKSWMWNKGRPLRGGLGGLAGMGKPCRQGRTARVACQLPDPTIPSAPPP